MTLRKQRDGVTLHQSCTTSVLNLAAGMSKPGCATLLTSQLHAGVKKVAQLGLDRQRQIEDGDGGMNPCLELGPYLARFTLQTTSVTTLTSACMHCACT